MDSESEASDEDKLTNNDNKPLKIKGEQPPRVWICKSENGKVEHETLLELRARNAKVQEKIVKRRAKAKKRANNDETEQESGRDEQEKRAKAAKAKKAKKRANKDETEQDSEKDEHNYRRRVRLGLF